MLRVFIASEESEEECRRGVEERSRGGSGGSGCIGGNRKEGKRGIKLILVTRMGFAAWRGKTSVRLLLPKQETQCLCFLLCTVTL